MPDVQPDIEVKDSKATLLAHDDDTGTIEALVSITNIVDHGNDLIEPGAYEKTIKERPHPRLLAGHDWGRIAGKVDKMEEWKPGDYRLPVDLLVKNAGALWVKARYNLKTIEGREAYERALFDPEGIEWSIGYDCSPDANGPRAYKDKSGVRRIKSLSLLECSDVVVGMAPGTRALAVKALQSGLLDPQRKYSVGELVAITTKVYAQETDDGSVSADYVDNGQHESEDPPEDGVDVGEDVHPIPLPEEDVDNTKRYTVSELKAALELWEQKDYEGHPFRGNQFTGGIPEGTMKPSGSLKPSTGAKPATAPRAPTAAKPPTSIKPPKAAEGEGESEGGSEGEKPEGGEESNPLEHAVEMIDELREGVDEGREMGGEYGERLAEPAKTKVINLGSWADLKAMPDPFDNQDDEDLDGGNSLQEDSDGYVEDQDGTAGDLASTIEAPEDANLGRRDWSAMKTLSPNGQHKSSASYREMTANPLYYATDAEFKSALEQKRDFDKNVGGGVDRDKLDESDFAGAHRSFPIVTPQDVADAAASIGRAKDQNPATLRANIIRIAKRKGPGFVAKLPDSWKADSMDSKAWVGTAGSFEATQTLLSDAADRWMDQMFPGQMVVNWVEATYPGKAIIGVSSGPNTVDEDAHLEFWQVPYSVEGDTSVTFGEPKALNVVGVAVDRPEDDSDYIDFLPAANVVAKSLAYKGANHLRRRYALLSHLGVDISATGLTPQVLAYAPSGTATIPAEGSPDYRTGQMDLSQPGTVSDVPSNTQVPRQGTYLDNAGNLSSPSLPSWFQGTYYVDNAGNLTAAQLPGGGYWDQNPGNLSTSAVPGQGTYLDNVGNMSAPMVTEVGSSRDAGTLTLAGTPRGQRKSLLQQMKDQRYRIPGSPIAEPGVKTGLTPQQTRLMAAMPELCEKAGELFVALKEGRVMSGANIAKVQAAHSALTDALTAAGVPFGGGSVASPTDAQDGYDEEGVKIEPQEAKADFMADVMAFRRLQVEMKGK